MAATNQKSGSGNDGGSKSVGRSHHAHSATAVAPDGACWRESKGRLLSLAHFYNTMAACKDAKGNFIQFKNKSAE